MGLRDIVEQAREQERPLLLATTPGFTEEISVGLTPQGLELTDDVEAVHIDGVEVHSIVLGLTKAGSKLGDVTSEKSTSVHRHERSEDLGSLKDPAKQSCSFGTLPKSNSDSAQSRPNLLRCVVMKTTTGLLDEGKQLENFEWMFSQGRGFEASNRATLEHEEPTGGRNGLVLLATTLGSGRAEEKWSLRLPDGNLRFIPIEAHHPGDIETAGMCKCVGVGVVRPHETLDRHEPTRRFEAESPRHGFLVVKEQSVLGASRMKVQLHPDSKEKLVGIDEGLVVFRFHQAVQEEVVVPTRSGDHPRSPQQPVKIAEPPLPFLYLGFKQKDGLPVSAESDQALPAQGGSKVGGPPSPSLIYRVAKLVKECTASGNESEVEHGRPSGFVVLRRRHQLLDASLTVPHIQTCVPERIEQTRRDLPKLLWAKLSGDQHQIHVRMRAQHLAGVASRRNNTDRPVQRGVCETGARGHPLERASHTVVDGRGIEAGGPTPSPVVTPLVSIHPAPRFAQDLSL